MTSIPEAGPGPKPFPRAILHARCAGFAASVAQACRLRLKGKPAAAESNGLVSSASAEAYARGIRAGMALCQAMRLCPDLAVVQADRQTCVLYSRRMFEIMRRWSPVIEETAAGHGFADITGMRQLFGASYIRIARAIWRELGAELGIPVAVGLAPSKTLAMLAASSCTPAGLCAVPMRRSADFLARVAIERVETLAPHAREMLGKLGMTCTAEFAACPEDMVLRLLGRSGWEIWCELNGISLRPIKPNTDYQPADVARKQAFMPPCPDPELVRAAAIRNLELAMAELRRQGLAARTLRVTLRHRDFREEKDQAAFPSPIRSVQEAMPSLISMLAQLIRPFAEYRAATVILTRLVSDRLIQPDLFADRSAAERTARLWAAVDAVNHKFGAAAIHLAADLLLDHLPGGRSLRRAGPAKVLAMPRLEMDTF